MASYKSVELSAELADELKKRLSLTVTEGTDTNGNPTIALGGTTPGAKNAFIRVKQIDWATGKDALGLDQTVFTPHVIQFVTEANYAGTTDNVADILTPAELLPLIATITARGTQVEWYVEDNGTAPVVASITATKLKATFNPSLYWGLKAQQ